MGFMDDILAQQDGGGMLGGLPASWQYQNPADLTPVQKQMMGMVGTQNPDQAGFNPLPASTDAFPTGGAAPITGLVNPVGGFNPQPVQAPAAPAFGAGATPTLFANSPGSIPGNPAMPAAPVAASDDDDEETPAAPKAASPIAFGGQMMPRIGPASAFTPDPAALPANAQPTQAAPAVPVASPSIGDKLMTGYQNLHHGGGLIGSIVAAVTGKRNDPSGVATDQQTQVANMTARALIARGVDPQTAIASVQPGNGEMLKELLKTALTGQTHAQETDKDGNVWDVNKQTGQRTIALASKDDKFTSVNTKNADGSESKSAFNNKTGEYTGGPAPAPPGKYSVDPTLTGKDRLEALRAVDPLYAKKLESMIAGDIPMPTGVAALRPDAKRTIEDALSIDGALSASDFATRAATRKDYASGIASRVTKSINTTIGHFATLDQSVDKLGNYSYFPKVANAVHDAYSSNMDPNYQKAKATFETNKEAAVKELDFALSGGHSSVSGSAELRDKFNRADSPGALHSAITEAMSLLQKRLESHTKAFTEGTKSQRDPQDFIYPENQQAFNRMLGGQAQGASPGVPSQPGAPAAGAYVWTPDKGLAAAK